MFVCLQTTIWFEGFTCTLHIHYPVAGNTLALTLLSLKHYLGSFSFVSLRPEDQHSSALIHVLPSYDKSLCADHLIYWNKYEVFVRTHAYKGHFNFHQKGEIEKPDDKDLD